MKTSFRNSRSRGTPAWVTWPVMLFLVLSLPACSSSRESYLKGALEEATQEDVVEQLGEPWKKKTSLLKGQSRWIYRYALTPDELDPMGVDKLGRSMFSAVEDMGAMMGLGGKPGNPLNPGTKPLCFHYILTFDETTRILQHWTREACADTDL